MSQVSSSSRRKEVLPPRLPATSSVNSGRQSSPSCVFMEGGRQATALGLCGQSRIKSCQSLILTEPIGTCYPPPPYHHALGSLPRPLTTPTPDITSFPRPHPSSSPIPSPPPPPPLAHRVLPSWERSACAFWAHVTGLRKAQMATCRT